MDLDDMENEIFVLIMSNMRRNNFLFFSQLRPVCPEEISKFDIKRYVKIKKRTTFVILFCGR